MKIYIKINSEDYEVDLKNPINIAIPMNFNGKQPNTYGVPESTSEVFRDGSFVGSVKEGGSCNFESYTLIPHCNGTHTECIGHISLDGISVNTVLQDSFILSELVSIKTEKPANTSESYYPELDESDDVITKENLEKAISQDFINSKQALILRTLPNADWKKNQKYMDKLPPFFTKEAMSFLVEIGVKHLLVDIPSVDRTFDDGKMTNHSIFWEIDPTDRNVNPKECSEKTITEMIYVSNEVEDGDYLLNLQIPAFVTDAAPSRPILYKYKRK